LPLFRSSYIYAKTIEKFEKDFKDSREDFIIRFKEKYNNPLPPSWMMLEITSFGSLSFVYSNLKPGRDKRTIANYFGLNERTFESWIHSIIYVRNICAHHGRLWNRDYSIAANIPTSLPNT
jgi:abortive infection bacteriophage resistance protein